MEASSFNITPTNNSLDENKAPSILILDKASEFPDGHFEPLEGSGIRMWIEEEKRFSKMPKRRTTTEEFGAVERTRFYDSLHYRTPKRWFQPLVPRQFLIDDTHYHQKKHRQPAWDELFLDLAYVAVISQLGEILKEYPITGESLNHFFLTAIPVWITWIVMDRFNNIYGSSNFTFKAFSWIYHILVLAMGINAPNSFPHEESHNTSHVFILSYFVSQVLAFLFGLTVHATMPRVALSSTLVNAANLLSLIPAITSLWFPEYINQLWWSSWILQIFAIKGMGLINHYLIKHPVCAVTDTEHHLERHSLFTIVVLGETFLAIMWTSQDGGVDASDVSTIFGFIIAICVQFMYFTTDQEGMKRAEKTSVLKSLSWQLLHLPFHLSIIIMGASIGNLMSRIYPVKIPFDLAKYPVPTRWEPAEANLRLSFTISISICLILLCLFVILQGRVPMQKTYFSMSIILGFRVLIAIAILFLGIFGTSLSAFSLLAAVMGLLLINMVFSIIGLQTRGEVTLRDTACHFRLGLR